jgi:hypothetical protein
MHGKDFHGRQEWVFPYREKDQRHHGAALAALPPPALLRVMAGFTAAISSELGAAWHYGRRHRMLSGVRCAS